MLNWFARGRLGYWHRALTPGGPQQVVGHLHYIPGATRSNPRTTHPPSRCTLNATSHIFFRHVLNCLSKTGLYFSWRHQRIHSKAVLSVASFHSSEVPPSSTSLHPHFMYPHLAHPPPLHRQGTDAATSKAVAKMAVGQYDWTLARQVLGRKPYFLYEVRAGPLVHAPASRR